ncbi:MAG: shikimate dehydrogenase [Hyphomicrobiales bacterium]|nr:shikimate dehydrogenase [Hyphomicrobiales bacterium]
MIDGDTKLIAHVGYPTATFRAPLIYNPWFRRRGINAAVVPLGVTAENFREAFPQICRFSNFHGALITMPHKVAVVDWLDEASAAVRVAHACNAVRRSEDGTLIGDMFDGEGFVRAAAAAGRLVAGQRVLIVGAGGVGSAIAAACAKAGAGEIALTDTRAGAAARLAERLHKNYPGLTLSQGSNDPSGFDIVVNATPLGTYPNDPLPFDPSRLSSSALVGEVVLKPATTALLAAARLRGLACVTGLDMLFEQIPAYLEFFGFSSPTAAELRETAEIKS